MKKIVLLVFSACLMSCLGDGRVTLPQSIGKFNKVLVVAKSSEWMGEIGDQIKNSFGEIQVGLPQPEKILSVGQVAPNGFTSMMRSSRNIMILEITEEEKFSVTYDKYARPQTIVYASSKSKPALVDLLKEKDQEIKATFKNSDIKLLQNVFAKKRLDDSKYKTLQNLNISLTIPKEYRTVDDTGNFLWLRQHLKSGIARGAGNSNILVYSLPLDDKSRMAESIIPMRDAIGEKYIPGSKEGMYMITEAAYTPLTINTKIKGRDAFETRGTWEVKNDFMAGPFLNYAIVDEQNQRLLVIEGFTYAPSINKREFVFELEAIAKSVRIN